MLGIALNKEIHRYFQIPLIEIPTECLQTEDKKHGWWYAHYIGQRLSRQLEVHPDKPPMLSVVGSDKIHMKERNLEETSLANIKGVEISEQEFNCVWDKYGGEKYFITSQRYFRIPLLKSSADGRSIKGEKCGWWYAHFDGQRVARQMELYPNEPSVLLIAGADDVKMCLLNLDATGLTRRREAEISEQEFECEWEKNGGNLRY